MHEIVASLPKRFERAHMGLLLSFCLCVALATGSCGGKTASNTASTSTSSTASTPTGPTTTQTPPPPTPPPPPPPPPPPGTGSDFSSRCTDQNVVRCEGFDSPIQQGVANSTLDSFTTIHLDPANDGAYHGTLDTNIKASGAGSLRFLIPASACVGLPPGSNCPNTSGDLEVNFSKDLSQQFGEGTEFYLQWRQRFDPAFISTNYSSSGGTGWKQAIIGEGDRPPSDLEPSGHRAYSCTQIEVVPDNVSYAEYATIYHSCGSKDHSYEGLAPHLPNEYLLQNAVDCRYSDWVSGGRGSAGSPGCFRYAADEWMTFQLHVKIGKWYKGDHDPNFIRNYHRDSTVELWIARENQPSKLVISLTDYDLANDDDGLNVTSPLAKYGKIWLLPYDTGRTTSVSYVDTYTWYDELIVSRRRIQDPNVNTPNPPDRLTVSVDSNLASVVNLAWRSNSNSTESQFKIERCTGTHYKCDYSQSFTQIATVNAGVTTYVDSTARGNAVYSYRVLAGNANGDSAYSNSEDNAPAAPSDLTASAASGTRVNLTWTDNSNDETGFVVERCTGTFGLVSRFPGGTCLGSSAPFAVVAQVGASAGVGSPVSFTDSTVASGTTYTYRVHSVNGAGAKLWWETNGIAYSNLQQVATP